MTVSGRLALDGTLTLSLLGGFTPGAGQAFDILDWGTTAGLFSSINLPALASGLNWNTSQLYTTGVISVVPLGVPGDYNNNGVVDAADTVLWRKYVNTTTVLPNDPNGGTIGAAQFNTWRANFGSTYPGSGSGMSGIDAAGTAVPEPASAALFAVVDGRLRYLA